MPRKLTSEWIGTSSLLATVVGSGIMAERLAGGNVAIALLSNTIPTGAILVVLIMIFGPISSAHLNPAVTIARGFSDTFADIHPPPGVAAFVGVQLLATSLATFFFKWLLEEKDLPMLQSDSLFFFDEDINRRDVTALKVHPMESKP